MDEFSLLPRNRFFEVIGGMNVENQGNNKVAMLSEIDMSQCVRLRAAIGKQHGVKPSYTALVTRSVALTLKKLPYANRMTLEWPFFRRIIQLNNIHITVAVERDEPGIEQAVYAGTVRNTDTLNLVELTNELQKLAKAQGVHGERWSLLLIRPCEVLSRVANVMFSVGARWRTSSKWWAAIAVAADGIGMLRVMLALDTCRPRNGRQYETRLGSRGALASGGRDE